MDLIAFEDAILRMLFSYWRSQHNPDNVPMKLSDIVHTMVSEEAAVIATLDALEEERLVQVEGSAASVRERSFRITRSGVRLMQCMLREQDSVE